MGLAQQYELRNSVWSDPGDGVLVKVNANGFGRLQGYAHLASLPAGKLGSVPQFYYRFDVRINRKSLA